jgi:hypothetical protein
LLGFELGLGLSKLLLHFGNVDHRKHLTRLHVIADVDANIGQVSGHFGEEIRRLKSFEVALVWRRWATATRRGRTTSTRVWLSAFVGFTGDGDADAAKCRSATMPPAVRPSITTATKTFVPVRLVKFILLRL